MADSSSTSSSSDAGAPRAFLLAAALVVAGEALVAFALPPNEGRHLVDDILADLESPQPPRPVLVWGDSVTELPLNAVDPGPEIVDLSSTQAISMAGVWFTYRRFLEHAPPPRLLVICQIPDSWDNDLEQVFTTTYFETCFLRWEEIRDFASTTGRWGQALRMAGNRFLRPPSMVRRASARRWLRSLRPRSGLETAWVPSKRVVGVDPAVLALLRERAGRETYVFSEVSRLYLEKLAEETARSGTTLVLATAALPRSVADAWRRNGFLEKHRAALEEFAARHPHVKVEPVDAFATWEDDDMYDQSHLKPAREADYARQFLDRVRARLAETR